MLLSPCATLLLTLSTLGTVKVWDLMDNYSLLVTLKDDINVVNETLDEFHCAAFPLLLDHDMHHVPNPAASLDEALNLGTISAARVLPKQKQSKLRAPLTLAVAGKCKDRTLWCEEEEDNAILPCDIKVSFKRKYNLPFDSSKISDL
ncbi:UNVERIFIED_CONTAM: hypothetical protein HDU68_010346 [Siphonaria sp. JEL0065]|nr:hypothetical protein HDU68_010346 [Siphonaria sp. JEL0065]